MRSAQRHGGMNTELAGCVRGGRDYAAFVCPAADYDWLAAQRRIIEFFHRNEEGVHVHMKDGAGGGVHRGILARASVIGAILWCARESNPFLCADSCSAHKRINGRRS